jgi:hypothetical protein
MPISVFIFGEFSHLATKKSFNATHTKETFCCEKKMFQSHSSSRIIFFNEISIFRK